MNVHILPLAITMMAGPQIMAAIVFVTQEKPSRVSLPFIAAVAIGVTAGIAIAAGLASALGSATDIGGGKSSAGKILELALVGLLIALAIKAYLGRETSEPPKWLGALLEAGPRKAFMTGLLLILLMPADVVIMFTIGVDLDRTNSSFADALPFIAATVLVAALPFLTYSLFRRRARRAMPKLRDWMSSNSWLVNIIVYCVFIALILK